MANRTYAQRDGGLVNISGPSAENPAQVWMPPLCANQPIEQLQNTITQLLRDLDFAIGEYTEKNKPS